MSITIKGIKMPKTCSVCRFGKLVGDEEVQCIINQKSWKGHADKSRRPDCPLIETPPAKRGKWITEDYKLDITSFALSRCSVCGSYEPYGKYCRNCGARMEKE